MIIKDTQKLLPPQSQESWEMPNMVLEVPPHGIPLHPKSIDRILAVVRSGNRAVAFRPVLPVTSELGLPQYPILAYVYPSDLSNISNIEHKTQGNLLGSIPYKIISQTDADEQLHYFAYHYGMVVKPFYVRVILGNTCNLKCVMCPYHSPLLKPSHTTDFFKGNKAMSWKMMERLATECGEEGIAVVIGNVEEPMLHPNLIDFIKLCRQQGVPRVHMTTNGQLLDENRAIALLKAGLTSIDISIDAANPDTYFKVRGASLDRVESNVINFLRLRDRLSIPCEVRTSFVRNQDVTFEEEQQFRKRWLAEADGIFVLNVAQYQETNIRLSQTNDAVQDSVQYYIHKACGRWSCLFPFTEMTVLPDGRIYYCIETIFRLGFDQNIQSLGDYNKESLHDIWRGNLFTQFRRDLILNQLDNRPACKNCDMWMSQVAVRSSTEDLQITTTTITEICQKNHSKL